MAKGTLPLVSIDRAKLSAACEKLATRWRGKKHRDPLGSVATADNFDTFREALAEAPRATVEKVLAEIWDGDFDIPYAAAHALAEASKPARKATFDKLTIGLHQLRIVLGDLHVRKELCNGGALIVTGNVTVDGLYWDRDVGCLLIALGDVTIGRANIYGGTRIRGELKSRVLYGIDHSDSLFVGGLRGALVMLADKSVYANSAAIDVLVGEEDRITARSKKFAVASLDPAVLRTELVPELVTDEDSAWEVPIDVEAAFEHDANDKPLFLAKPKSRRRA